jgi:hypothetical protein
MRSHGVRNFPYSDTDGRIHAAGIDKSSPAFRAARRSYRALEPGGQLGEQASTLLQRQLLAFAACMRAHGAHRFAPQGSRTTDTSPSELSESTRTRPSSSLAASTCRGKLSGSDAGNFFSKLLHRGR